MQDLRELSIGKRVQELRRQAGLSQEALADQLNVSRQAIGKWETDQSLPGIDNLQALAKALQVSCDMLLTGEPSPRPAASPAGEGAPPADPPAAVPEEEISLAGVRALLEAQEAAAKARHKKRARWLAGGLLAAAMLLAAAGIFVNRQLGVLNDRINQVSGNVAALSSNLNLQIDSLRSGIEEGLKQQVTLAGGEDHRFTDYDFDKGALLLEASVTVREFAPGTTAALLVVPDGDTGATPLPMTEGDGGLFTLRAWVPEGEEIAATLQLTLPDGTVKNELIWTEYGAGSRYHLAVQLEVPQEDIRFSSGGTSMQFDAPATATVEAADGIWPTDVVFELWIDGQLSDSYRVEDLEEWAPRQEGDPRAVATSGTFCYYPGAARGGILATIQGFPMQIKVTVTDNLGRVITRQVEIESSNPRQ